MYFQSSIFALVLLLSGLISLAGCRFPQGERFRIEDLVSFTFHHEQLGDVELSFACRDRSPCPVSSLFPAQPLESEWVDGVRGLLQQLGSRGRSAETGETSKFRSEDSRHPFKLLTKDGESHIVLLGRYNSLLDAYYVLYSDRDTEYSVVSRKFVDNLQVAPNRMFQSAILGDIRGELSALFLLTERGESVAVEDSGVGWKINGRDVDSLFLQSFIRDLYGLRFVALEKDPRLPQTIFLEVVLKFRPKEGLSVGGLQTETVTIFSRRAGGYWVKRGSSPYVYLLDTLPGSLRNIRGEHFLSVAAKS